MGTSTKVQCSDQRLWLFMSDGMRRAPRAGNKGVATAKRRTLFHASTKGEQPSFVSREHEMRGVEDDREDKKRRTDLGRRHPTSIPAPPRASMAAGLDHQISKACRQCVLRIPESVCGRSHTEPARTLLQLHITARSACCIAEPLSRRSLLGGRRYD